MKLSNKKKIALVLSGGGVKAAAFHIGVCLALKEKGFKFAGGTKEEVSAKFGSDELTIKFYVGSSAGSVISTFLAAGHSLSSIIQAFERGTNEISSDLVDKYEEIEEMRPISYADIFSLNGKDLIHFVPNLLKMKSGIVSGGLEVLLKTGFKLNGIFTTKGLESYMRQHVWPNNTFQGLGVDLYIVTTQLNHSRKVIFGAKDELSKDKSVLYSNYGTVSDAVAASASLPPVFAPYAIKNRDNQDVYFFDGEIRDTMSTHIAADHDCDLVIASYSIQPYHYHDTMGSLHQYGIPVIMNQALYQVVEQKVESHIRGRKSLESVYNAVDGYLRQINIDDEHRQKLLSIITERTNYKPETDYIYIHPDPQDYKAFFADHFSLTPHVVRETVHSGFKAALYALRKLDI